MYTLLDFLWRVIDIVSIKKKKVLAGMSGGVDSSVAAALLIKQGYDVTGITMKVWNGPDIADPVKKHGCYGAGEFRDIEDAARVAEFLNIPFHIVDVAKEYEKYVLDYFRAEYLKGRTPNPCIMCNSLVKFGFLLERAVEMGLEYDYFATGHYVRRHQDAATGRLGLKKAVDRRKDQSYFLAFLNQEQISRTLFPLGELTKDRVKKIAREMGLWVAERPESQDFIEGGDYSVLFDAAAEPGPILDVNGRELGRHRGIIHYTVGQRKGLGISAPEPLFVLKIDSGKNAIIVGPRESLFADELIAGSINWMTMEAPVEEIRLESKIRLTHGGVESVVTPLEGGRARVRFSEPQMFATPGQIVAFYENEVLVGGGIIEEVFLCNLPATPLPEKGCHS